MATTKRPCCVCRRWFEPDRRLAGRQVACFREECQRERHRRSCVRWRGAERKRERDELLNKRVVTVPDRPAAATDAKVPTPPLRDAMALGMTVQVRQLVRLLGSPLRDAMPLRKGRERRDPTEVSLSAGRDATDVRGPGP